MKTSFSNFVVYDFTLLCKRLIILLLVFLPIISFSQASFSASDSYSQNFNILATSGTQTWNNNSTLTGWYAQSGLAALTSIRATNGSATTAGLCSFGNSNSSDRGLGGFNTEVLSSLYYGLVLTNSSGATYTNITITYTLEQWYTAGTGSENLNVSYRTGTISGSNTPLTEGVWTNVSALNGSSPATGPISGSLTGESSNNRKIITSTLYNINLASGQSIFIRWQDALLSANNGLGIDDVTIQGHSNKIFYSNSTGYLNTLASWGQNSDGTGTSPTSFTAANQVFYIQNNATPSLSGNWTVSGTNSKVILGNGNNAVNFTIPAASWFQGPIEVNDNAILTLENSTLPTISNLSTNSTIVYGAALAQNLTATTYGNLHLTGSGTKSLGANVTINGELRLNTSKLQLDNYNLLIAPTGSITGAGANNYIVTNGTGALQQMVTATNTDVLFPVGNTTYNPALVKQGPTATADVFSMRVYNGLYPSYLNDAPVGQPFTEKVVNRTWILKEGVQGGSDATLTIRWKEDDALSFDATKCQVNHFEDNIWNPATNKGATLNNGMYEASMSNITSFSPFGAGEPTTLPIELLSFKAVQLANQVTFKWQTATETNNDYFTLEQSDNARDFKEITRVKGAGTSFGLRNYTYNLPHVPFTDKYYRLKQTDLDGKYSYSKIIALNTQNYSENKITVYPNPSAGKFQVLGLSNNPEGTVAVYDLTGRLILALPPLTDNKANLEFDISNQKAGFYILQIKTSTYTKNIRLVKY